MSKTSITPLTTHQAYLLTLWQETKQQAASYYARELELRAQIMETFWSKPVDNGSQTLTLAYPLVPDNFKLELSKPLNYNVDGAMLDELEQFCNTYGIKGIMEGDGGMFRYKAECSVTFFNNTLPIIEANMNEEVRKAFRQLIAQIITIKPGSPQVKLVAAK